MEKKCPFPFSVVMAVYNVEPFLREAVDSLIAQDFGFEKIQLILVDDGSTDGSPAICDEYAARYPRNLVVIHKENGGVSSARNAGLERAEGEVVNFLDSDDKLSPGVMTEVAAFFHDHGEETDAVSTPMYYFDWWRGEDGLNDKFKRGDRVINLDRDYSSIQVSVSAAFIKREALAGKTFNENLSYGEDAEFMLKVLCEKRTLGVVGRNGVSYLYRSRQDYTSATQILHRRKDYYLPYVKNFVEDLVRYCKQKVGFLPKFVQYTLAWYLQVRVLKGIQAGGLTEEEKEEYERRLLDAWNEIEDEIILEQADLYAEHKLFLLERKHGQRARVETGPEGPVLCVDKTVVEGFARLKCELCFLTVREGACRIEGILHKPPLQGVDYRVGLYVDGAPVRCEIETLKEGGRIFNTKIMEEERFLASFPLDRAVGSYRVQPVICVGDRVLFCEDIEYQTFFPISDGYERAYYQTEGWKVARVDGVLTISAWRRGEALGCELAFLRELWKKNELGAKKAVAARLAYHLLKPLCRRPIWLFSDRFTRAGDNGEDLFRYVRQEHREIRAYFVLSRDSRDYPRLKELGPVVEPLSFRHKLLHLLCGYNVSSQADQFTVNPMYGYQEGYQDILQGVRFIFLQHGVVQDDLSSWLKKQQRNISGFVTSAEPEYRSILEGSYSYTEEQVWLTGLPRYDHLYSEPKRKITIMPTWRKYLTAEIAPRTGMWPLLEWFEESEYFQFYAELLHHRRLLDAARVLGYRLQFFPHPNLQPYVSHFADGSQVELLGQDARYRDVFAESDLVVTDYSSAAFDFAYLKKPVVYCQFDREDFFGGAHGYVRGYFDYERDGFGEVEYDLESTVDRIIEYMETGCQMKEKYRERIDRFFAFHDRNNCRRVYEKIRELDQKGE